ncbi:MAG: hypothetical protein HPAVJP_3060 [Candidatus Hepatoplasma vulgare]|nr:MAG: hypothetical protein HPAVJP_3060 [Candidatus Hepatoplasma sp.]
MNLKTPKKYKSDEFYNFFYLIIFYIKKLFNFKNVVFFIISLLLFLTLIFSVNTLFKSIYQEDSQKYLLFINQWRSKMCFFAIYITFITNYCYIYLKKNNFNQIKDNKNTLINIIIVFLILTIFWVILFSVMIFQMNNYKNQEERDLVDIYKTLIYASILMFVFNLISIFIISLIYETKNKKERNFNLFYIFLLGVFVLQFLFYFVLLAIFNNSSNVIMMKFNNISKILVPFLFFLIFLNLMQRIIIRRFNK